MEKISVVDFARIAGENASKKDWLEVAEQVKSACESLGFLHIVNHGIDSKSIEAAFGAATKFFALPQSRKSDFKVTPENKYKGYLAPGQELFNSNVSIELRESFAVVGVNTLQEFPEELPEFRHSVLAFWNQCSLVTKKVLKLFAIALDLSDESHFVKSTKGLTDSSVENRTKLRFQWYPPINDISKVPENSIRCGEHTDYGVCTFLFQNMGGGLEVKNSEGKWIPATPVHDAILLNLGDVMEMWTGGRFKATPHRVLIPKEEQLLRQSRLSIAFFTVIDDDYMITPLKSSTYYDYGKQFEAMTYGDFLTKRTTSTYRL